MGQRFSFVFQGKLDVNASLDRRVVITGMAAFSPLGFDLDGYWQALVSGTSRDSTDHVN